MAYREKNSSESLSLQKKGFLVLLFSLLLNLFFYHVMGPVSIALIMGGLFVLLLASLPLRLITKNLPSTIIHGALLLFFSTVALYRDNGFVSFVTFLASLAVLLLFLYTSRASIPYIRSLMELVFSPVRLALRYFPATGEILQSVLQNKSNTLQPAKKSYFKSIIVGVIIALPVLLVLIGLLTAADPIYATFIKNLFSSEFLSQAINRFLWTLFIFLLILPVVVLKVKKDFTSPLSFISKFSFVNEIMVVLTLVAITLASFLIIQWPYVFAHVASETSLSQFGVNTYSEYVRRGFIELLLIATIVYGLIWTGLIALRNEKAKSSILPKIQLIALLELGIFIISIARRVFLYQELHGGSLVRIYGTFFLGFLSFLIITLFLRHFIQRRWVLFETAAAFVFLAIISLWNAEEYIASINPPTVNKRIDHVYLSRLSADGATGWKKSYDYATQILSNSSLFEKPLLDKNERQQVAFAGMIIGQLSENYDQLIRNYGTDQELKEYLINIVRDYREEYANYKTTDQFIPLMDKGKFEKIAKKLVEGDTKSIANTVYTYPPAMYSSFESTGNYAPLFYTIVEDQTYYGNSSRYFDTRDKLYTYNTSKKAAFDMLTKEITLSKLLILQQSYKTLYRKISKQPEQERKFDMDISLSSPLL